MELLNDVSVSIGRDKYTATISDGRHVLLADESAAKGGSDKGPEPKAYLMAALGSCTAITLRMYADHKQWPLEGVDVSLNLERITGDGKDETRIIRRITLKGELDAAQRERLLGVANSCPVHKILNSTIHIESSLQQ